MGLESIHLELPIIYRYLPSAAADALSSGRISIGTVAVTLLVAAVIGNVIYNIFFHPLAHIPGPFSAKFSSLSIVRRFLTGHEEEYDRRNFEKYGDLYRTSPNAVVFCNPAYLPLVYHRNADKGPSYLAASGFGLVAIPSHRHHAAHRRRLQPPFSVSAVKKSTPLIEACVESWVQALLQQTPGSDSSNTSGNEIDFTYWPSYLTYDTLSELCFGSKFGMIEQRRDVNRLIGGLEDCLVMVGALIRWPSVVKWAERLGMGWLGFFDCTENTPGIGSVCKFGNKLVDERLKHPSEKPDILNNVINTWNPDGAPLSPADVEILKKEVLAFLTAGTDSSATVLRDLFYSIFSHPGTMEKLYAEIPASLSPSPTAATAADTPYLSACISEALRLFPPIVTPFPRTVSAPGLQLGQYFIPGGYPDIEVFAATAHMGLSREVFGADAAEWRPERWLEIGPEEKRRWERSLFAWGYSSRVCLGKPVAEVEMLLAVKRFVECFVAEEVKLEDLKSFGMRKHKGLKMKLRRRTA